MASSARGVRPQTSLASRAFDAANYLLLALLAVLTLGPFVYLTIGSLTEANQYRAVGVTLNPAHWSLNSYIVLLGASSRIYQSLKVTLFITVVGTLLSLIVTSGLAYGLSKKDVPGRNFFIIAILFTMLFSGGLVPFYLIVKSLALINSVWSLILPVLVNAWYMLIIMKFYEMLPAEVEDAARIDGCSELSLFWRIALPLSKPVLSEVTPVNSLAEGEQLASAVERTRGFYMLAENYRFINDVELIKRLADDGRFGRIRFAEGEYLHDCRDLALNSDGTPTWRGLRDRRGGLYCTHSLMPLLYITGDRILTVSCLEAEGGIGGTVMLMRSVAGSLFKVRLDTVSPRPHNMAYYAVQGETGAYESWRGLGDEAKVWLGDAHEPSRCRADAGEVIAQWHPLRELAPAYIPDRFAAPEVARTSGHFGADYWMLTAFARALLNGEPSPIDVYRALDCCVPGIVAIESRGLGGAPLPVPSFCQTRGDALAAQNQRPTTSVGRGS